jgi:4-amino-4-deoxy-L-arabinose transferase-like glycosyltransferase
MTTLTDQSSPLLEVDATPDDFRGYRDEARAEPNYRALALGWVVIATLVRLWIARLPLGNGEAYYYSWSKFLDWSYYDHPPLLAWVVRLTTALGTSPATVRLGPVLAAGITGYLLYRLAERWFTPRAAFFALVVFTALPVFLFSSFVVNPEALLAPLWIGFLLTIDGMRDRDEPVRPLLAGLLLGLAFLSKYTAVLLVPATLIYVASSVPMRRWVKRPSFYAGGAVALALAMPVLVWNQTRGWPSVRLHLVERVGVSVPVAGENTLNHLVEISSSPGTTLLQSAGRVLVGQLLAYSPLLAPLLVMVIVRSLRRARRDDRDLFVTAFTLPVLLPLLAAMVQLKDAEMHWTMVAFIPAAIGVGGMLDRGWETAKRTRAMAVAGVGLTAVAFLLANVHASSPAIMRLFPRDHYDPRADMINELVGWDQVRASVAQAADSAPGSVVLAANHYALCGRLMYEMGDDPKVFCPTARRSAYDFFARREPPATATVIALTTDIHEELPAGLSDRKCTVADQVDVERGGRHVARYFVQSCPPVPRDSEERASRD